MPTKEGLIIPGDKDFHFGAAEVNKLHDYDDVDVGTSSHHHTLGGSATQAAAGNHGHSGTAGVFSKKMPTGMIYKQGGDSIPASTWTRMTNTNVYGGSIGMDPKYMVHDAPNGEIEIQKGGLYLAMGYASLSVGVASQLHCRIRVDGYSRKRVSENTAGAAHSEMSVTEMWIFVEGGHYFALDVWIQAGGTFAAVLTADEDLRSHIQLIRISDL
jgi:hypothetical protein